MGKKSNYIFCLSFLTACLLFFSCGKKEDTPYCTSGDPNGCLGSLTKDLNISTYLITKDTTYKFVSPANDTIKLTSQTTYTYYENVASSSCSCGYMATKMKSQNLISKYVFQSKNLALQYHIATNVYFNKVFGIDIGDTNNIIHQVYNVNDTVGNSAFFISNFDAKRNDLDTIAFNGKLYHNIFNTYDDNSFGPSSIITSVYYAKGIGIIRFTYNGVVYDIL